MSSVILGSGPAADTGYNATSLRDTSASGQKMPLSTRGRYVVDADGNRFKLKSVNWFGPNDFDEVVEGLDKQTIEHIVSLIKKWGLNSVRLTFSNEMIRNKDQIIEAHKVSANPQFIGLSRIQIFDQTIEALTNEGIVVVLNNHSTYSRPCCGFDFSGLWYHLGSAIAPFNQTEQNWIDDWLWVVRRYKSNKLVVGADLRNEVRTMRLADTHLPESPNWGSGDKNDWHRASREAARKIIAENPELLIVVEGINWAGSLPALGGYRPGLTPVSTVSVQLQRSNKLIYAYHNYPFTGPRHNGDRSGGTANGYANYAQIAERNTDEFHYYMNREWAYVLEEQQHYTAPVWISEFGVHDQEWISQPGNQNYPVWFDKFVDYMIEKDVGYAWWPLNVGVMSILSDENWTDILPESDWRYANLRRLFDHDGRTGLIPEQAPYSQMRVTYSDDVMSEDFRDVDWKTDSRKGLCPDGHRMIGAGRGYHGLCTNDGLGDLWAADRGYQVVGVTTEFPRGRDWAGGLVKYECPLDHYVSGFSKGNYFISSIFCAKASRPLGNQCNTVWFADKNTRFSEKGGDFATGVTKGQCADNQYMAGLSRSVNGATAKIALCCGERRIAMSLIQRFHSRRCIEVKDGEMRNGQPVVISNCNGSPEQQWFYDKTKGQFSSKKDSRFCLDNSGRYSANGTQLKIWQCFGDAHPNQAFDLDDHILSNRADPRFVFDTPSANDGTPVVIWSKHGRVDQRWTEYYH